VSVNRLLQRPIVVHRVNVASEYDEYGNEIPGVADTFTALGYLEQIERVERVVDAQLYSADWWLALPAGTALDAWDRIEVPDLVVTVNGEQRAAMFEVIGTPDRPRRARQNVEAFVQAELRTVTV